MLKLTLLDGKTLWIFAAKISSIGEAAEPEKGTEITFEGFYRLVQETPEEIFAMPEMKAALDAEMLASYPLIRTSEDALAGWSPTYPRYQAK